MSPIAQDFTQRISIVVDSSLPSWQVLNTVGHIAAYFGSQIHTNFDTGESFTTKDGIAIPRNSQYPIVIFAAKSAEQLKNFAAKVRAAEDVKSMFFIKEMIETTDDAELEKCTRAQLANELTYLGVGLFGKNEELKKLTNKFKLWA